MYKRRDVRKKLFNQLSYTTKKVREVDKMILAAIKQFNFIVKQNFSILQYFTQINLILLKLKLKQAVMTSFNWIAQPIKKKSL